MVMGEGCASPLSHRSERLGRGWGAPFPPTTPLRARMISQVPRCSVSLDLSLPHRKGRGYEYSCLREKEAKSPKRCPAPRQAVNQRRASRRLPSLGICLSHVIHGRVGPEQLHRVGPRAGRAARPGSARPPPLWLMLPLGYGHLLSYQGSAAHRWQGRAPLAQLC